MQGPDFQPLQLPQQMLICGQRYVQFLSDFDVGWGTMKLGYQRLDCLLNGPPLAPQLSGAPIERPQTIKNGTTDTKLRIGAEFNLLGRIEFTEGVEQAQFPSAVE